jgi:hypothetical protein
MRLLRRQATERREQFNQAHTLTESPNHVVSDYFYPYEKLTWIFLN